MLIFKLKLRRARSNLLSSKILLLNLMFQIQLLRRRKSLDKNPLNVADAPISPVPEASEGPISIIDSSNNPSVDGLTEIQLTDLDLSRQSTRRFDDRRALTLMSQIQLFPSRNIRHMLQMLHALQSEHQRKSIQASC